MFILISLNAFAQDFPQWQLSDGARTRIGKGQISDLKYSPDGTRLAVASYIRIWFYYTATGQKVALLSGHTSEVSSVALSANGSMIASGSRDRTVCLWDAVTGHT